MIEKIINMVKNAAKSLLFLYQTLQHGSAPGCSCSYEHICPKQFAGDYTAGTTALSTVAEEVAKYIPIVVQLCYAIAGVVAILGAISVYIAMNNEEQDVKNILVLRNAFEKTRKQMKVNTLSINALSDNLNFPMFAKLILKKT